jgi:hypothetical protein
MATKSGSFDISGPSDGTTWTLNDGNTGIVESGGSLTAATKNPIVTFGSGTTTLTNSGTISSTTERALDAKNLNSGSIITVTNNAGAKILSSSNTDNNDAFKISGDLFHRRRGQ